MGSGRFWGAHSLRMTPRKRVQVRGGGSSWPQSSRGSAVLVLCLHSGDGAVKSRLLQKGTGHSQTREQWKNKFVIVTPESIKQTGSDLQKKTAPGFCAGGCFMVGKEGLRSVQAFFYFSIFKIKSIFVWYFECSKHAGSSFPWFCWRACGRRT